MDRLNLQAEERIILGKKVARLRKLGKLPGHVFGKKVDTEHVTVDKKEFLKTFRLAGETGVIDLKIGAEKVRPVMVRGFEVDPITGEPTHIDFYQVNLSVKVTVPVPLVLIGDEPEKVKLGEAMVLQTLNEVQVEALPNDLIEKIEVNIASLQEVDDAITVASLTFDREKLNILADPEEVVVKLAPIVVEVIEEPIPVEGEAVEGAEGEVTEDGEEGTAKEGSEATEGESSQESSEPAKE